MGGIKFRGTPLRGPSITPKELVKFSAGQQIIDQTKATFPNRKGR